MGRGLLAGSVHTLRGQKQIDLSIRCSDAVVSINETPVVLSADEQSCGIADGPRLNN